MTAAPLVSINPRTGLPVEVVGAETTPEEVDACCERAARVARTLDDAGPRGRAAMLRAMADELAADAEVIVALADRESALGEPRLRGELARSSFQLRLFAEVLADGAYLEAIIDHADPQATPAPRPDVRRMQTPVGPVAVFGASNFPLAFSVPGGDTASALAAGCPVVVKAHPTHPATSVRCAEALRRGAQGAGLPEDVVGLVHGVRAGSDLVRHPAIRAVGFTGSVAGGRALFDLASSRADPIPFYGELGSINPVLVTPAAAAERADEIAAGLIASCTGGAGQFCTKPGVICLPTNAAGARLRDALGDGIRGYQPAPLLAERILDGYRAGAQERAGLPGAELLAESGLPDGGGGFFAAARLIGIAAATLLTDPRACQLMLEECFGPLTVVIDYADEDELFTLLGSLPGTLTATLHGGAREATGDGMAASLVQLLKDRAGRLIWDGYPTGVAVTWAMQHGGPYPASTAQATTSVGAAAIQRWLRPVAYQSMPDVLLPPALQEANPWRLPRRVDGRPVLP